MATLETIEMKIRKLQAQAEALIATRASAALDEIRALMKKHGLTTADIEARTGAAKVGAKRGPKPGAKRTGKTAGAAAVKGNVPQTKGKLPPKYRHPKTGETWSGYARPPAWIKDVKDRSRFLIASDLDAALAAATTKRAVKKASTVSGTATLQGQRKGSQPVKYLDPKTGASWSGRGRAPAWLGAVKDRTKFLVEGVDGGATGIRSTDNAGKAKSSATSDGVGKKAVARKAVAKKAAVRKTQATPRAKTATLRKARDAKAGARNETLNAEGAALPESVNGQASA